MPERELPGGMEAKRENDDESAGTSLAQQEMTTFSCHHFGNSEDTEAGFSITIIEAKHERRVRAVRVAVQCYSSGLGAGTSLPGLVAAKVGADVTLTDDANRPEHSGESVPHKPARSGHLGEGNKETTTASSDQRPSRPIRGSSDAMESSNPNEQTQVHDIREYDLDEADFNDDNDECENVDNLDVNCDGVGNENLDVGDEKGGNEKDCENNNDKDQFQRKKRKKVSKAHTEFNEVIAKDGSINFERLETTAVVHRLGLAIVNHQHKQVSAIVRWSPPFVAVEAEPTGSSPLVLTPGKATLRGLAAGRGRASRTRHGGRRPGGRDWAATGRTRERGRRRSRLALSRCMGCGLVRLVRLVSRGLVRLVRILVRLVCRGLVRLVRITCEGNGKKRRVSGVRVRKPALLARGRSGNIHRYIQVGRMHIFHVDSQPLVKACSVQIDLLVLADRCGEAENFLKLVGVLFHRAAILTDVGEHAKGVSPEARTEAKVAPLLEVPPRDGWIFQLQAKVPCLRHTGKMKRSQAHELPGRGVLCLKELLATLEPGRRILTPIKAWELQSGELRRRRGRDIRRHCCLRLLGRRTTPVLAAGVVSCWSFRGQQLPEHLPDLALLCLHSRDSSLKGLDRFS
nr:zinc finger BED domain-containing protein RICESLEEPER 2-like [Ipomoea batatas]